MAEQYQRRSLPTEGQPVDRARSIAGSANEQAVVQPRQRNLFELLVEGVEETCPDKVAAPALGLPDQSYYSKCKVGERPAPRVDKVTDLPEETQRAICAKWARQLKMRVSEDDARVRVIAELARAAVNALEEIA